MDRRRTARMASALAAACLIAGIGSSVVFAGEITGRGDPVPTQGKSWCRFSGLNDKVPGEGPVEPQAQAFGIEVREGVVTHPSQIRDSEEWFLLPGYACNPSRSLLPPLK